MEEIVHISSIYSLSKVEVLTEIYYIANIAKYLAKYNMRLSVAGVFIPREMKDTLFYRYLASMNVEGIESVDTDWLTNRNNDLLTTDFSQCDVYFAEKSTSVWKFDYDGKGYEPRNNMYFKGLKANQSYVNFIAYLTVERLINGCPQSLILDFSEADVFIAKDSTEWDISDLWILYKRTQALSGWVDISLPKDKRSVNQLNYEAYWKETRGNSDVYTAQDKIDFYKRTFKKQDVVFLYTKSDKGNSSDCRKTIESCKIAIISKATSRGIELLVYTVNKSIASIQREIDLLPDNLREMYAKDYARRYSVTNEKFDWIDIGLEHLCTYEKYFITDLNCDDSDIFLFKTDNGMVELELNSADGVYALLSERNIDFNKERFENLYFSKNESLYKKVVLGGGK